MLDLLYMIYCALFIMAGLLYLLFSYSAGAFLFFVLIDSYLTHACDNSSSKAN